MQALHTGRQSTLTPHRPPATNGFLAALGTEAREALLSAADYAFLDADTVLMTARQPLQFIHLLEAGTAAIVGADDSLRGVDLVLVGPENVVGIGVVLGQTEPMHGAVMRISGSGHRIGRRRFEEILGDLPEVRTTCLAHAALLLDEALEAAGCNAQHRLVPRLARWILEVCDRGGEDDLTITHERLARALGVRRAGVTMALHELEGRRLIRSTRCRLTIRDRAALSRCSCPCYRGVGDRAAKRLAFSCA